MIGVMNSGAPHRHDNEINKNTLDALSNIQLEAESAIREYDEAKTK